MTTESFSIMLELFQISPPKGHRITLGNVILISTHIFFLLRYH